MTARDAVPARTTALPPARDARLVPYCTIALGGLGASLIAGEPALAALALPFALALALGLRRTGAVSVSARFVLDNDQVLEGDVVTGRIELHWDRELAAQVLLHRLNGVGPVTGEPLCWSLPAASHTAPSRTAPSRTAPSYNPPSYNPPSRTAASAAAPSRTAPSRTAVLPIRLVANQWGLHTPGEVWLRLEAPFGLMTWTGKVAAAPTLRVLPGNERLTRLLHPAESRAVLGVHRSARLGEGTEFAELRPYTPGDRLRDLNWSATARRGRPFVNRRHPELSGEVVIVIDAFADGSTTSAAALARAARAAWAIASVHLRANDRVGLAGLGGSTRWLAPAGGRLARYRLLETLLRIGGEAADPVRSGPAQQPARVPASALVIALTPLQSALIVRTLKSWRARGRAVAVVAIDTSDLIAEPASHAETLARRLWLIEANLRKRELTKIGIPVVTATGNGPMTPVVAALRRARRATHSRAAR